jgi:nucleotide-binding universal stress UspA family protein
LDAVTSAFAIAKAGADRILEIFPAWSVRPLVRADSPAWGVIKEADEWHPDLVVVGSEGRSGVGRFVMGSVSHKVLTEGRCNVRIARGRDVADGKPVRLLVGVDGSTGSAGALDAMAARRWPPGTEALLLAAIDPRIATGLVPGPFTVGLWIVPDQTDHVAWLRSVLNQAEARARAPNLAVRTTLEEGDPKRLLIEKANDWQADSIFVGARGLSGVERLLLGSVSSAIAMRAPCSVEVVHGPRTSASAEKSA